MTLASLNFKCLPHIKVVDVRKARSTISSDLIKRIKENHFSIGSWLNVEYHVCQLLGVVGECRSWTYATLTSLHLQCLPYIKVVDVRKGRSTITSHLIRRTKENHFCIGSWSISKYHVR